MSLDLTSQSDAPLTVASGVKQEWQVINWSGGAPMSHCQLEFLGWALAVLV